MLTDGALPINFQFSQSSLQNFNDCQRCFYLRYIRRLAWPSIEAEPALENERFKQQGADFHRLVYQYWLGIPPDRLSQMNMTEELREWWDSFMQKKDSLPGFTTQEHRCYPEFNLSATLADFRLVAKYDLILTYPEGILIFDWKTSRTRPKQSWLAQRLQTRVYPYLLSTAGQHHRWPGQRDLQASQIKMIYWFAAFPDQPETFSYSDSQYEQDRHTLSQLITTIVSREDNEQVFPLSLEEKRCAFCMYRSLCNRGVRAGFLSDAESEPEAESPGFDLDFDQVAEIAF